MDEARRHLRGVRQGRRHEALLSGRVQQQHPPVLQEGGPVRIILRAAANYSAHIGRHTRGLQAGKGLHHDTTRPGAPPAFRKRPIGRKGSWCQAPSRYAT